MDESNRPQASLQNGGKPREAPPTIIVIFGASGDLTARKLIPGLYNLNIDNLLPEDFCLFGYGRQPIPDAEFREKAKASIRQFSRRPFNPATWARVEGKIFYERGDYQDLRAYQALSQSLHQREQQLGREVQFLFYISTPPMVFQTILQNLGASGLAAHHRHTDLASKVIIEKPFGRDLGSARELNRILVQEFDESQVYRIDHYLGKETVQDLLVLRFANAIFEPIWNRQYIDCVQITVAEELGIGNRGSYYDQSGALRDMIQNHTMQLFALTAMEPPVSLYPEAIRDEKVKVLKAIQPPKLGLQGGEVVRAQYLEGIIDGEKVPGYLQEPEISPQSQTESYTACRFFINNWRWKDVPFYIRSGKRMARRLSEITIQFKCPPGILFTEGRRFDVAPNTMVIRIQPDEGVTFRLNSKVPGLETRTEPVTLDFRYATTYGSNTPEAYERLILDAMTHDSTLFIRGDETEASWQLITPILDSWQSHGHEGLEMYEAGSWGPLAAERLLQEGGHRWHQAGGP